MEDHKSLGTELPKEMARVRDQVMPAYREIGQAGAFGLRFMTEALDDAPTENRRGATPSNTREQHG